MTEFFKKLDAWWVFLGGLAVAQPLESICTHNYTWLAWEIPLAVAILVVAVQKSLDKED